MHGSRLLHKWLADTCPQMHAVRREALAAVVLAAMVGTRLTVTTLGRSMLSQAKEKHCIKRADRLLSNRNLQAECFEVYVAQARYIIGAILIQWLLSTGRTWMGANDFFCCVPQRRWAGGGGSLTRM